MNGKTTSEKENKQKLFSAIKLLFPNALFAPFDNIIYSSQIEEYIIQSKTIINWDDMYICTLNDEHINQSKNAIISLVNQYKNDFPKRSFRLIKRTTVVTEELIKE